MIDDGIPPTDATGVATKLYALPFGETDDVLEVEFEIAPQPRFAVALPPMVIPGVDVLFSATRQYFPVSWRVAVADALIVGGVDTNIPEKGRV
jgi:hypothetical protein